MNISHTPQKSTHWLCPFIPMLNHLIFARATSAVNKQKQMKVWQQDEKKQRGKINTAIMSADNGHQGVI